MVLVHLSCSLKQTRVKIEYISWVGLTTRWSSEKKRHLTVGNGLLGEIIINDKSMLSVVAEEFSNGTSRVWSQELERSSFRGRCCDDDGVF